MNKATVIITVIAVAVLTVLAGRLINESIKMVCNPFPHQNLLHSIATSIISVIMLLTATAILLTVALITAATIILIVMANVT